VGELGPRLTQCRLAEACLRTKWRLDSSNRLTTTHQLYAQTGQREQRFRCIGRTVTLPKRRLSKISSILMSTMRSGLIETFKIVNIDYDINTELFFHLDEGDRRGRDQKLLKKRFRLNVRKYVFEQSY